MSDAGFFLIRGIRILSIIITVIKEKIILKIILNEIPNPSNLLKILKNNDNIPIISTIIKMQ